MISKSEKVNYVSMFSESGAGLKVSIYCLFGHRYRKKLTGPQEALNHWKHCFIIYYCNQWPARAAWNALKSPEVLFYHLQLQLSKKCPGMSDGVLGSSCTTSSSWVDTKLTDDETYNLRYPRLYPNIVRSFVQAHTACHCSIVCAQFLTLLFWVSVGHDC